MLRFVRTCMHVAVLAMALMAIACGDSPKSPSAPTNQDPIPATPTVAITGGASTMRAGEETTFTAVANGQPVAANWSTNPGSAQLIPTAGSATTKFAPTAEGKYTVTATAPGANPGTTVVTVTAPLPIPPFGELGMELAYGGRTAIRPPVTGPITVVVPAGTGYALASGVTSKLATALKVAVSASSVSVPGTRSILIQVPANMDAVCGPGAAACFAGSTLYLARWGLLEDPSGMLHELLHLVLYDCTIGRAGCNIMGSGDEISAEEQGIVDWVQRGGK